MTIGENIRAYRKKAGLTQKQLGEKLGMSQQQIGDYENNRFSPREKTLIRIADALDTSIYNLFPNERYTAEMDWLGVSFDWIQARLPAGYNLRLDENDAFMWIEYPDGGISKDLSLEELHSVIEISMDYMKYQLEKLRREK